MPQLGRVVHVYSRTISDASLPATIQTTSVRLLLNLTDYIYHNQVRPQDKKHEYYTHS